MKGAIFFLTFSLLGAELDRNTEQAFNKYVAAADREMASGPIRAQAKAGAPAKVFTWGVEAALDVEDGLIHDWGGVIFVGDVTAEDAVELLSDFNRHSAIYAPEVAASRLLGKQGDVYRSSLRLVKKKVITVVLDTEYETRYTRVGPTRWLGVVRSTRIQEVPNPGEPGETLLPVGRGHGFLWRLNSWWLIEEREGGVLLQLRSASLTRDIPLGLAWAIKPMVTALPREAVAATLEKTAAALRTR
jgi:hypothetical protein